MIDTLRRIHRMLGIKYRVDRMIRYWRRFGVRRALAERRRLWSPDSGLIEVQVPGVPHAVAVRAGTADASTFEHIFIWNDYDLKYPREVRTIIDAGANTGMAAVFFANRFPGATIISIEPEIENFKLLQRNTASYSNVIPLRAALWSEDTLLGLSNPDDHVDSYRFNDTAEHQQVEALSVPSILARFGLSCIDVMKVDIEGGEAAVFAGRPEWVDRAGMFIVELHGDEATQSFTSATAGLRGARYQHGENSIVVVDRTS